MAADPVTRELPLIFTYKAMLESSPADTRPNMALAYAFRAALGDVQGADQGEEDSDAADAMLGTLGELGWKLVPSLAALALSTPQPDASAGRVTEEMVQAGRKAIEPHIGLHGWKHERLARLAIEAALAAQPQPQGVRARIREERNSFGNLVLHCEAMQGDVLLDRTMVEFRKPATLAQPAAARVSVDVEARKVRVGDVAASFGGQEVMHIGPGTGGNADLLLITLKNGEVMARHPVDKMPVQRFAQPAAAPVAEAERHLADLLRQLDVSDGYAKDEQPKTDVLPSVWQIQNAHLRLQAGRIKAALTTRPDGGDAA